MSVKINESPRWFASLLGGSICLLAGLRKTSGWKDEHSAEEDWTDWQFELCKEDGQDFSGVRVTAEPFASSVYYYLCLDDCEN